jgi:arylformamidase
MHRDAAPVSDKVLAREYDNRCRIPEHPEIFQRLDAGSARARATMICYLDREYGSSPAEKLDIFPARKGDGTALMFIHGGYWRSMDKRNFSFLAPVWVDAGVSVILVNHGLAPGASIEEIVCQMLRASSWLYRHAEQYGMDEERLYVAGHSSGAHLAAMMMATLWQVYEPDLPKNLFKGALALSGLYDLRPFVGLEGFHDDLRLDETSALRVSPAFLPPATRSPVFTSVGSLESSEFHRQNALLTQRWKSVVADDLPATGANHFTILDHFADRGSAIFAGTRRMMKLDR